MESFFQVVSSFVGSTVAVLVDLDEELPLEVDKIKILIYHLGKSYLRLWNSLC